MLYRPKGIHVVDLFQFSRGTKWLYLFARRLGEVEREDNSERRLQLPSPSNREVYPIFQPQCNVD